MDISPLTRGERGDASGFDSSRSLTENKSRQRSGHSDFLLKGQQEAAFILLEQLEAVPSVALKAGLSAAFLAPQLDAQLEAQPEVLPSVALRAGLSAALLADEQAACC